jgi:hypothetical protein
MEKEREREREKGEKMSEEIETLTFWSSEERKRQT